MGVLLFLIAYVLFFFLSIVNFFIVVFKGGARRYFLSSAISLDRYANRELRTLWNVTLRKKDGYEFGTIGETINSVLGKNKRDGTLTKTGKILAKFLDFLDKNHCINSIDS